VVVGGELVDTERNLASFLAPSSYKADDQFKLTPSGM